MGRGARRRPRLLATKLRKIRDGLSLSQGALIEHLGLPGYMNQGEISDFEHGVREPDLLTLKAYADAAGVSIDCLVNDNTKLPDKLPSAKYMNGEGGTSQKGQARETTAINLLLIIADSANGTTGGENHTRARIEKSCLKQHRMKKLSNDEYELKFSHRGEADLDEQIYAVFGAIKIEARKRQCSVKVDIWEKDGTRYW